MTVKVLEIMLGPRPDYSERWGRMGIYPVRIPYERARELIRGPAGSEIFDAIVVHCQDMSLGAHPFGVRSASELVLLASDVRSLPESCAMADGRQWRSIPIVALMSRVGCAEFRELRQRALTSEGRNGEFSLATYEDPDAGGACIQDAVQAYRLAVLAELDDMGFIVQYDKGRYRLGPALRPRDGLFGRYYFGPSDERSKGFTTVHRDQFGIQVEVEQFEALINRADVTERELQEFFESHPHFLSQTHMPLAHVRLPSATGKVLIPDFILKPIVAQQRDSTWEVLDLKLPQEKLLSGRGPRAKLSSSVMKAIRQLRDYHENIGNPAHADRIQQLLGHRLRHPSLGILIGKLANTDVASLEREQQYQAGVRLVTYDEVLERQQVQLMR